MSRRWSDLRFEETTGEGDLLTQHARGLHHGGCTDQSRSFVYGPRSEVREFTGGLYRILKNRSIHSQPVQSWACGLLVCRTTELQGFNTASAGWTFPSHRHTFEVSSKRSSIGLLSARKTSECLIVRLILTPRYSPTPPHPNRIDDFQWMNYSMSAE